MFQRNTLSLLAAGALLALGHSASATILPVPLYPQQTDEWCWAASGQMIMTYLGAPDISQCEQANNELGFTNCCTTPTPSACVHGGYTQFNQYGFNASSYSGGALPFSMLGSEFASNRPVEFAWSWTGGGGHVMVALGTSVDSNGNQWVYDNNPWPPNQGVQDEMLSYSAYVSGPTYTHQNDSYQIADAHVCSADFDNMPAANFQSCFDYQSERGRYPVTLSAYNSGGSTLMAGSFQAVPSRPVRTLMTAAQFNSYFSTYAAEGYRPDSVSVLSTSSGPLFTAIWVPATDGAFVTYFGMTDATFGSSFSSLGGQGYVITDLFGYQNGGVTNYVATWVKKANSGYYAYVDMTAAQYNTNFSNLANQGFQPVRFSAYPGASGTLYAAIWYKQGNAFDMYYNMSSASYQSTYNSVEAQGFHLTQVSGLNGTLAAIWNK